MKIAFRFENGTSECILTPENARDKSYIDLCIDGRSEIKLKPTTTDSIILTFTESKPKSIKPTIIPLQCPSCLNYFHEHEDLKHHIAEGCQVNDPVA